MTMRAFQSALALLLTAVCTLVTLATASYSPTCDSNSLPAEQSKASNLTPNTIHKLCPSTSSLGPPICGDGGPFSFYYTSPTKRRSSNKILIEFMGGGACWDANSCDYNAQMLSMQEALDNYMGYSCSEIQAGMDMNGGQFEGQDLPANMLCAQKLGEDLDLQDYHSVVVPYCTQDVHMGDSEMTYDGDGTIVYHRGGRNMLSVLEWVYKNFPHPEHVILTGCSAGGTALPVAHDLIYHHYNSFTKGKQTVVSTLMDSAVYLTPAYFMQNGISNWNVQPIMNKIRFNWNKYGQSEDFSQQVINHVLKRTSRKDALGFVTHNNDPVSIAYYEAMSGYYNNDDDGNNNNNNGRQLEDNEDAVAAQWWSELSSSFNSVMKHHKNVDTYILNGEGHCSFGLYYAQTEGGQDFKNWAEKMLLPPKIKKASVGGRRWFWLSSLLGAAVVAASVYHQRRMKTAQDEKAVSDYDNDDSMEESNSIKGRLLKVPQFVAAFVSYYAQDSPVTIGYGVAVTVYFICAMAWHGLGEVLYNPSVGPSPNTLSAFGINNPTMVVYHSQISRLVTSTFLCSGIITYAMLLFSLYKYIRPLEQTMRATSDANTRFASRSFLEVACLVTFGSNLVYACFASGASCSSMTLIFGLQAFSVTMHRYHHQTDFSGHWFTVMAMYLLVCLLPFNSWIMMTSAVILGVCLAVLVYHPIASQDSRDYSSYVDEDDMEGPKNLGGVYLTRQIRYFQGILALFAVMLLLLLFRIRRPDRMYERPFMTSCDLVYTTNVNDIVNGYLGDEFGDNGDGNERFRSRWLEENQANDDGEAADEEYMCAQLCLPHLVSRPAIWGANIYSGDLGVKKGQCEDVGYSEHIADKTFSYMKYSADVELYFQDGYSYNQNDE